MPERVTAQRALRDLAERNGWSVHEGSFSERRLVFERGVIMLTADFHPGGALKQAARYECRQHTSELTKSNPARRQKFEGWLREKQPRGPKLSAATQSAITFAPMPSGLHQCERCGAAVWATNLHQLWHSEVGR